MEQKLKNQMLLTAALGLVSIPVVYAINKISDRKHAKEMAKLDRVSKAIAKYNEELVQYYDDLERKIEDAKFWLIVTDES